MPKGEPPRKASRFLRVRKVRAWSTGQQRPGVSPWKSITGWTGK